MMLSLDTYHSWIKKSRVAFTDFAYARMLALLRGARFILAPRINCTSLACQVEHHCINCMCASYKIRSMISAAHGSSMSLFYGLAVCTWAPCTPSLYNVVQVHIRDTFSQRMTVLAPSELTGAPEIFYLENSKHQQNRFAKQNNGRARRQTFVNLTRWYANIARS